MWKVWGRDRKHCKYTEGEGRGGEKESEGGKIMKDKGNFRVGREMGKGLKGGGIA